MLTAKAVTDGMLNCWLWRRIMVLLLAHADSYFRTALFMPALSAATHDANVRAFYQSLIQRGKKKMQALCAVMRKMLTGIWACLKLNTPFDSSKLFSEEHKKDCALTEYLPSPH